MPLSVIKSVTKIHWFTVHFSGKSWDAPSKLNLLFIPCSQTSCKTSWGRKSRTLSPFGHHSESIITVDSQLVPQPETSWNIHKDANATWCPMWKGNRKESFQTCTLPHEPTHTKYTSTSTDSTVRVKSYPSFFCVNARVRLLKLDCGAALR